MGKREVESFLSHLATSKKVAASTQNQALNALVFLYRAVLHQPFDELGAVERPLRRPKVPVVLGQEEAGRYEGGVRRQNPEVRIKEGSGNGRSRKRLRLTRCGVDEKTTRHLVSYKSKPFKNPMFFETLLVFRVL